MKTSKTVMLTPAQKRAAKRRLNALINDTSHRRYVPEPFWVRRNDEIKSLETMSPSPCLAPAQDVVPDEIRLQYANQLAPLYNKGPVQLITGLALLRDLGKKTNQLSD